MTAPASTPAASDASGPADTTDTDTAATTPATARVRFSIQVSADRELPGFGAYVAGTAKSGEALVLLNFDAMMDACVDYPELDWREFFADTFVHEFLHVVQDLFGQEFSEYDVDGALEAARGRAGVVGAPDDDGSADLADARAEVERLRREVERCHDLLTPRCGAEGDGGEGE